MKAPALFLGASLTANIVLIACLAWRALDGGRNETPVARAAVAVAAAPQGKVAGAEVGRDFATMSAEELRDRLRALDLPPLVVEQLVVARIKSRLQARQRELMAEAIRTVPPWRLAGMRNDRFSILTPEQRKELRDLEAEIRDETLRLLGPGPLDRAGYIAFKYGFVPPEKAVLLDALDRDYENLGARLKDDTRNLRLPEDREREKFLKTEQQRDLAALLTPAEIAAYEMRVSPTAQNASFQIHMAAFQPSEAEFRALFAIQKAEDTRKADGVASTRPAMPTPTGASMIQWSGMPLPEEEVRAALSPERFADWQLTTLSHYQSLARQAAATGIAPATVKQVATLLSQTAEASWRIAEETASSPADKKAALASLAATTRSEVQAKLGTATADTYLKSVRWFDSLATGTAIMITGSMTAFRPVDPPPRPAPPKS